MDPTLLAALSGILGAIIGAVLGGVFALKAEIQPRWRAYIVDTYNSSGVVREHLADCQAWYCDDLLRLLPESSPKTLE